MLTTKQVLDTALSRSKDTSATLRAKMLIWLNSAMQDVVNDRNWTFLEKTVPLPIVGGQLPLPADFGGEIFIKTGIYIFTVADRLTLSDAARWDAAGGDPHGYTIENDTTLTFHPTASGTATLTYTAQVPAAGYTDGATPTIFPQDFVPYFERELTAAFYEYDVDADRLPVGIQLSSDKYRTLKKLDNSRRPLPSLHPRGYVR